VIIDTIESAVNRRKVFEWRDFRYWHKCEVSRCPLFGRYQGKNGRRADIAFL